MNEKPSRGLVFMRNMKIPTCLIKGGCGKTRKGSDEVCLMGAQEGFLEEDLFELGPRRRTGIFHVNKGGEKDLWAEKTA